MLDCPVIFRSNRVRCPSYFSLQAYWASLYESHGVQVPLCLAGAWFGSLGAHTPLESIALALNSWTNMVRRRTTSWCAAATWLGLG